MVRSLLRGGLRRAGRDRDVYLDSGRGISAGLTLGALLDAGADAALVQRILGTVTIPRIALMQAREITDVVHGISASVAVGPVPHGTRLLDVIQTLEKGPAPLAVRTWGGGLLARLLEAEAMARGVALDAVPLTDIVTVAELLAVSAALAALRVVRVYAAPLAWSREVEEKAEGIGLSTNSPARGGVARTEHGNRQQR